MSDPTSSLSETSDVVRLRLPRALKEQASAHARELGMSDAEYHRHSVRTMLGFYRDPAAVPVGRASIGNLQRRSSFGEGTAQLESAKRTWDMATGEPNGLAARELIGIAFTYAMMAVAHGIPEAHRLLGCMKMTRADLYRADVAAGFDVLDERLADEFDSEGLAHVDIAADRGDTPSADRLQGIADCLSPAAVLAAPAARARIEAGE